jgi:hypothetical protein
MSKQKVTLILDIDWDLLREQKAAILKATSIGGLPQEPAEGLLNFIDAIQDQAVDTEQVSEEIVFQE